MKHTLDRVPPHLRRYVVEQDYARYTPVDQAVWRFVLLQMYDKLRHTAHQAYRRGLGETGISVERIPSLSEMDACLNRVGWGAVGVDGFIPPRAFTEFQALGILPICAEIRTADHLVYTPAPDIIHEAAGHAPIIVESEYAEYLRQIGEVGAKAFGVPEDGAVYDAIFALSEIKERPGAAPNEIAAAEDNFEQAQARAARVSEATRVSRLYWWTAEYGLVGTPRDYKLYGAGLLSSLGESHSCHDPSVSKLPLSASCVDVAYDITKAQPQLFVVEDFAQLSDVLAQVSETLAFRRGGRAALEVALESQELCSLKLDTGLEVIGTLHSVLPRPSSNAVTDDGEVTLARLHSNPAFARHERLLAEARGGCPDELWLVCGQLPDGSSSTALNTKLGASSTGADLEFLLGAELRLTGKRAGSTNLGGQVLLLCERLRLEQGTRLLASSERAGLLFAGRVLGAQAGAVDADYYPASGFNALAVPKPRSFPAREQAMMQLYGRALDAHANSPTPEMVRSFASIHARLQQEYPQDWLLRWNILESLVKRAYHGPLADQLQRELAALERDYDGQQPIASGLRYLGFG